MSDLPSSQADPANLDAGLARLTEWSGPTPGLWRRALKAARHTPAAIGGAAARPRIWRRLMARVPGWGLPVAAAAAVFIAVGVWMQQAPRPVYDQADSGQKAIRGVTNTVAAADLDRGDVLRRGFEARRGRGEVAKYAAGNWFFEDAPTLGAPFVVGDGALQFGRFGAAGVEGTEFAGRAIMKVPEVQGVERYYAGYPTVGEKVAEVTAGQAEGARQVVRKATIELAAKDVRAAFAKAAHLVSPAQGEFVQDSSVTGSGNELQAALTLRVAATRLGEVLNDLRQLGEVKTETTGGEDVTAQAVDIEARLRNEQRVEAELLELLDKRSDSPLKEVLELRTSLGNVRQSIEQLTAQRQNLARLVELASVLVLIRPAGAPPVEQPGLLQHWAGALRKAVSRGVHFLIDTIAGIISILIGGLVWWILLVVALIAWRIHRRRRASV